MATTVRSTATPRRVQPFDSDGTQGPCSLTGFTDATEDSIAVRIERDGFAHLPAVLTMSELGRLRAQAAEAIERGGRPGGHGQILVNAVQRAPELAWSLTLPNVLEQVRSALGSDEIVMIAEANVHRNFLARRWHKDIGEYVLDGGYFGTDPMLRNDCQVLKVAVYLQDHLDGSGLLVRRGSHKMALNADAEAVVLPIRAGDAVLFDVRLTHRGATPRLSDWLAMAAARCGGRERRGAIVDQIRRGLMRWSGRPDRLVVFSAFGLPNAATREFSERTRSVAASGLT